MKHKIMLCKPLLEDFQAVRPHLDLVLLPRIFDRLEDVPCAPASHLQPGNVLSVPALDQQSCSDRWDSEQKEKYAVITLMPQRCVTLFSQSENSPVAALQAAQKRGRIAKVHYHE